MDNTTKQTIVEQLTKEVKKTSLNKTAKRLFNISSATISNLLSGKWDKISDEMFLKVKHQLNRIDNDDIGHADTRTYDACVKVFTDAKLYATTYAVCAKAGSGKTYSLDRFASLNKNVIAVKCLGSSDQFDVLSEICRLMGISRPASSRGSIIMREIAKEMRKREDTLIVLDEIEKTKGTSVYKLVIDMYNHFNGMCGIVLLGTPNLKAKLENFNRDDKPGFDEIYSRIGGNVIELPYANSKDAKAVCEANEVDTDDIVAIVNDSKTDKGNYDLRRVDRIIHAKQRIQNNTNQNIEEAA